MKLGLKRDEIKLVDYSLEWNEEFQQTRKAIEEQTGLAAERIEHIGSTAIKDMPAKPIIDILVGVDNLKKVDESLLRDFSKVGFLRLKVERPEEKVLAKFTDDTYQEKTHFIHLVNYQKDLWNNLLFFRDYLNTNEEVKHRYMKLKQEYINNTATGLNINDYTKYKEDFVKNILSIRNNN
ncbi:GrpB family protein [Rummeliibacillus sp. G93]|uniref:GrpB family protein n=1 Tax=Rummeliibacillus sp. G93 TaxID=2939494 RepID=UPI00201C9DFA|nr:GrpB family protein [Rummeliibacillus sp. G93]UQW98602.1 GrpB family protein [Rummeliibacillus sp. G93]